MIIMLNMNTKTRLIVLFIIPNWGIFNDRITVIPGAWTNEMLMSKSLNNLSVLSANVTLLLLED